MLDAARGVHNNELKSWLNEVITLCKPERVHWCDGSREEYDRLCRELVDRGTFIKLNERKRPGSYLCRRYRSLM